MEYDLKARFYDSRLNVNQVNDIVFTMPRDRLPYFVPVLRIAFCLLTSLMAICKLTVVKLLPMRLCLLSRAAQAISPDQ